ncbi:zinc finger and BTB domain-containing protein 32 [Protopterus annectens]|uniref:zinc finger and BTB domain-containing protein 32 n=1 Tax=Protopterus annectens TaxID=7888 RepID=UPI001CFB0587|nr:zinc finger and BTB domain-containing protein 32 [Protopterus annectens]
MAVVRLQNPHHSKLLLEKANQMRHFKTLCDVVIHVDNEEFHVHSLVLACTSRKFEVLFQGSSKHYTLDFLTCKTFQQILDYAYTESLEAHIEDLSSLIMAAEMLEIHHLEKECLKTLQSINSSSVKKKEHDIKEDIQANQEGMKSNDATPKKYYLGKERFPELPIQGTLLSSKKEHPAGHNVSSSNLDMPSHSDMDTNEIVEPCGSTIQRRSSINGTCDNTTINEKLATIPKDMLNSESSIQEEISTLAHDSQFERSNSHMMGEDHLQPTRNSVITTTNQLSHGPNNRHRTWPAEVPWANHGMLTVKPRPSFVPHSSLVSYQIGGLHNSVSSSLSLIPPSHLTLSTPVSLESYIRTLPHNLLPRAYSVRPNGHDILEQTKSSVFEGRAETETPVKSQNQSEQHR